MIAGLGKLIPTYRVIETMSAIRKIETRANAHDDVAANSNQRRRDSALVATLVNVRLLLIAMWLGAALFFSAAVAPSAFAVLNESRDLAGAIVARTLTIVNMSGFVIGLLLLASTPIFHRVVKRSVFRAEMIALAFVIITTGVGQWIIRARLDRLRVAIGRPVDALAASDPLRIAFGQLHFYSVVALGLALVAAAVAFFLMARREINS